MRQKANIRLSIYSSIYKLIHPFSVRHMKKVIYILYLSLGLCIALMIFSYNLVENSVSDRIYKNIKELPNHHVGLVLGCSQFLLNGHENLFFKYRIDAAFELYAGGKVRYFIVSGDNSRTTYDEPSAMKNELVKKGVPSEHIFLDYAGFRTLDSVVRTGKVFSCNQFIVISQLFHIKRAVYIGLEYDYDVIGYAAKEVNSFSSFKTKAREILARVKMFLDLKLLNTQPKFLGPRVNIPSPK